MYLIFKIIKEKAFLFLAVTFAVASCTTNTGNKNAKLTDTSVEVKPATYDTGFKVEAEAFADLQILRYQVPGFSNLPLAQKQLAYYLYEAALCGNDIIYDQKSRYGLMLRRSLENIYGTYTGDKTSADWKKFEEYCGRVWFSNGNHHHYGNEKFVPACSTDYFMQIARSSDSTKFPLDTIESVAVFLTKLQPIVYDLTVEPKLVNLKPNIDNVAASSVNFYEGVTQKEVESFYAKFNTKGNAPSWGLNSKLTKENGKLTEKIWKVSGMYSAAIEKIAGWLEKAASVAENEQQKKTLLLLVQYYKTGDLKTFDEYNIEWVKDIDSRMDVVNGFIEVYLDPIGKKGIF